MEHYSTTFPDVISLNLVQFASKYSIHNVELTERTHPVIVKTFPNFSSDPKGRNYACYCKYQLIKYKPWHRTPDTLWGSQPTSCESFIRTYYEFLNSTDANQVITNCEIELARAQLYQEHPTQMMSSTKKIPIKRNGCTFVNSIPHSQATSSSWTWHLILLIAAAQMEPTVLLSCPNWIYSNRVNPRQVDISSLNTAQQKAYDIVADHHTAQSASPLKMMVLGTADSSHS